VVTLSAVLLVCAIFGYNKPAGQQLCDSARIYYAACLRDTLRMPRNCLCSHYDIVNNMVDIVNGKCYIYILWSRPDRDGLGAWGDKRCNSPRRAAPTTPTRHTRQGSAHDD
jgi:hypothetical protein